MACVENIIIIEYFSTSNRKCKILTNISKEILLNTTILTDDNTEIIYSNKEWSQKIDKPKYKLLLKDIFKSNSYILHKIYKKYII